MPKPRLDPEFIGLSVRLTRQQANRLNEACAATGLTMSEMVRAVIGNLTVNQAKELMHKESDKLK